MAKILWADTETYSTNDIKRGSYVYAEASQMILFVYAIDDGPVGVWQPHENPNPPADLRGALWDSAVEVRYHNVDFDHTQMQAWPWCRGIDLDPRRFYCTMTAARMAGLPGSLDALCKALGLPESYAKRDGSALIRKFCCPNSKGKRAWPHEHPEDWARFVDYALNDVVSMRECCTRFPDVFSPDERKFYAMTKAMNDAGVPVDREFALLATAEAERFKAQYKAQGAKAGAQQAAFIAEFSGEGQKELSISSQQALLSFLTTYGVSLPNAQGATIETFLASATAAECPPVVAEVLGLRLKANKAATSKYKSILAGANLDSRCRGTISFYGAARTGRDAGRRIQPQNLARPVMVGADSPRRVFEDMEVAVEFVENGGLDTIDEPLTLLSDCVRGVIAAPDGKKFCQADLSNIEGRVCPWLAGEQWKLDYFSAFDRGDIPFDNYVMAYAKSFGVSPESVTKPQRAIGKVMELASLYGGSVGAYITFASLYRVDAEVLGRSILASVGEAHIAEARRKYDWYAKRDMLYGLTTDAWTGIMAGVISWRASHPNVVASWRKAEEAFVAAIGNKGVWFEMAHRTHCLNHNGWMLVQLPSGRRLVYPNPRVVEAEDGGFRRIMFKGVDSFTRKFGDIQTGGPRLIENLTQAVARDCMFYNLEAVEQAGYPVILRIHDELLCETPDLPEYTGDKLAAIMGQPPVWAPGLPMAAAGDTYYRYQK